MKKKKLPLLVSQKTKYTGALAMYVFAAAIYLATNHFPSRTPELLTPSLVDQALPFLPLSFWVYISEFALFVMVIVACQDVVRLNRYFYGFVALQIASALIFLAWPTTFPRGDFPLPQDVDFLTYAVFGWIRSIDNPHNTTPSLHVSSVYLCSFAFWRAEPRKFWLFIVWSSAIAIATMTTKQHYFVDVVTGFTLTAAIFFGWSSRLEFRPWKKRK